jgi:hypothetical protein
MAGWSVVQYLRYSNKPIVIHRINQAFQAAQLKLSGWRALFSCCACWSFR